MKRIPICLSVIALWTSGAAGQEGGAPFGFEVASIKPSSAAAGEMHIGVSPGGVFTARNVTLRALVQQAYELRSFQISGGPAWLDKETYDIAAKANSTAVSDDDVRKMTSAQRDVFKQQFLVKLRTLLADRFQLKVHQEIRELPVYALVIAKNGLTIQASKDGSGPGTGLTTRRNGAGQIEITGKAASLGSLVKVLSNQVDRLVLDKTGLNGEYDFKMTFAPDPTPQPPDGQEATSSPSRIDTDGPSMFTALQEQVGLKLEAQKGPVQILVVDDARKASAN